MYHLVEQPIGVDSARDSRLWGDVYILYHTVMLCT